MQWIKIKNKITIIYIVLFLFIVSVTVNTIKADEQIIHHAFTTVQPSHQSFGDVESMKVVNTSYFWSLINQKTRWRLEGYNQNTDTWVVDNTAMQMEIDQYDIYQKVTLNFTSPYTTYYRFTFAIELDTIDYISKSTYEIQANISIPGTDTYYTVVYNWSDLQSLIQNDKITVSHGRTNHNGEQWFWFRINTVNKIPAGTNFIIDPYFGYQGVPTSWYLINDKIAGTKYLCSSTGLATNITAQIKITGGNPTIKCALYNSDKSFLIGTEEKTPGVVQDWIVFNLTTPVQVTSGQAYYIVAWSDANAYLGYRNVNLGVYDYFTYVAEAYGAYPDPISLPSGVQDNPASIYCSYTSSPVLSDENPSNQSTTTTLSPKVNVTTTNPSGLSMDVTFASNYTGGWVNYQTNSSVSNGSYSWDFTNADEYNQKYFWKVYCNNSFINISELYWFMTPTNLSPVFTNPIPSNNSNTVETSITQLNITINDPEGDTFNWSIETNPDIGSNSANDDTNGTKTCNVAGLVTGETYTWYVNATDSAGSTTNHTYHFACLGNITFWCYDETNPSHSIPFGIEISNQQGTELYQNDSLTSGDSIDIGDMPTGDNVIFVVNSSGYETRIYVYDIEPDILYNFSFYLPPSLDTALKVKTRAVSNPSANLIITLDCIPDIVVAIEGYNESLYGHWYTIGEDNYTVSNNQVTISSDVLDDNTTVVRVQYYCESVTQLYTFRVIDEYSQPIPNAKIQIKRYINTTDIYENVSIVLTDGNGYVTCYLVSEQLYKFQVSKTDFITEYATWVPTIVTTTVKTFLLYYDDESNVDIWDGVDFSIEPFAHTQDDDFTLYFNISSSNNDFEYTIMTIYYYDNTTGTWHQLYSLNNSNSGGHDFSYTTSNGTGLYGVQCQFKHEEYELYTFGVELYDETVVVYSIVNQSSGNMSWLDDAITSTVGASPVFVGDTVVAYTSIGIAFLMTILLFTFSTKFAGFCICINAIILGVFRDVIQVFDSGLLNMMIIVIIFILGIMTHIIFVKES